MTREEEIKQAVENNLDVSIYTPKDGELLKETFYIGAEWADNHPKSPWISVTDDLPCNHEELWAITGKLIYTKKVLVTLTDGTFRLLSMFYNDVDDKWEWEFKILRDKIVCWMPIPELPKE